MSKKLIHIVGAGGPAGVGMTRCLKGHFDVQGHDQSPWAMKMMECEDEETNIHHVDMIIPVPDAAVRAYADHEYTYLPTIDEIRLCQDKAKCAEALGDLAPKTYWVRDTKGAGGKGAQMCSEYLPGRNTSVELLYWRGEEKAAFMKERLSYSVGSVNNDVTGWGTSAVSKCIWDSTIYDVASEAVHRVSKMPHGVFAVDLRYNDQGVPKVTEINPGRFLTMSYEFYRRGYNLPKLYCNLYLYRDDAHTDLPDYPLGKVVIKQIGQKSWYGDESEIEYPSGWWKG